MTVFNISYFCEKIWVVWLSKRERKVISMLHMSYGRGGGGKKLHSLFTTKTKLIKLETSVMLQLQIRHYSLKLIADERFSTFTLLTLFDMGGGHDGPPKCFWPLCSNAWKVEAETWWLLILIYGASKKVIFGSLGYPVLP